MKQRGEVLRPEFAKNYLHLLAEALLCNTADFAGVKRWILLNLICYSFSSFVLTMTRVKSLRLKGLNHS